MTRPDTTRDNAPMNKPIHIADLRAKLANYVVLMDAHRQPVIGAGVVLALIDVAEAAHSYRGTTTEAMPGHELVRRGDNLDHALARFEWDTPPKADP